MKKSISILLVVVMLMGLSVSALAVDDLTPPLWERYGYGSMQEMMDDFEMSEEEYQMWVDEEKAWEEMENWTDEQWEAYNDEQEVIWEQDYQEYLAAEKESMGLVYDINVMFRDAAMTFTDAVPEITNGRTMIPLRDVTENFGATVEYDDAEKAASISLDDTKIIITADMSTYTVVNADGENTMELDSPAYIKDGRMFVPVRNVGEAFGYDLIWDDEYRTAVILDKENIINEINSELTVLNKILAMGSKVDMTKTYEGAVDFGVEVTTYPAIDADYGTYEVSMTADVMQNMEAMHADIDFDLSGVTKYLENASVEAFANEEDVAMMEEIIAALEDDGMEFIANIDVENFTAFYKAAIFNVMLEEMGQEVSDDTWLEINLNDMYAMLGMNFTEIMSMAYGVEASEYTIGDLIYMSNTTYGDVYSYMYITSSLYGLEPVKDTAFTETSKGYALEYTFEDEYSGDKYVADIDITVKDDVAESITGTFSIDGSGVFGTGTEMAIDFEVTAMDAMIEIDFSMTDVIDVLFTVDAELDESNATVPSAPPEGANIVNYMELLESMGDFGYSTVTATEEITVTIPEPAAE